LEALLTEIFCSPNALSGVGNEFEHHHRQDDAAHERLGLQPAVALHAAQVLRYVVAVPLATAAREYDDHLRAHVHPADDAQDRPECSDASAGRGQHRNGGHHHECRATCAQQSEALLCADQAALEAQHQVGQPGTGPGAG